MNETNQPAVGFPGTKMTLAGEGAGLATGRAKANPAVTQALGVLDKRLAIIDPEALVTDSTTLVIMLEGLQAAQTVCHELAAAGGWWIDTETGEDVRNWPAKFLKLWIASKLMLIVSETGEAMEGHRKDLMDDHLPHRKSIEVEGADLIIRALDLYGGLGYDLAGAIIEKLAYNQQRADHKLEHRTAPGGKSI